MTVQKAIQIIDWWINHKRNTMEKFRKEWKFDSFEEVTGISKIIFDADKTDISNLEKIKVELVPKCKHPKKMRDRTADGQWYCMNCNFDL